MAKKRIPPKGINARRRENVKRDESSGVVREDELYTLPAIKRRLDVSDSALRAMIDSGLKPISVGKRKFFLGRDVLAFFENVTCAT